MSNIPSVNDVREQLTDVAERLQPIPSPPSLFFLIVGLLLLFIPLLLLLVLSTMIRQELGLLSNVMVIIGGLLIAAATVMEFLRWFRDIASISSPPISNPDDLALAVQQLAQNYELSRSQTNSAFVLSALFMIAGLLVILLGSVRALMGLTDDTNTLTIIAGVISEFISVGALALYRSNFMRLNETSSRLYETWKIFAAYRLTKDLSESERDSATLSLIAALTGGVSSTLEIRNKESN